MLSINETDVNELLANNSLVEDSMSDSNELEFTGSHTVEEGDRVDALGDITDPNKMTLEDFKSEWLIRDSKLGLQKNYYFQYRFDEKGYGRNRTKTDINEQVDKLAEIEEVLVSRHGQKFVNRIIRMSKQALVGDNNESVWFVSADGNKVMIRSEVLAIIENIATWLVQDIPSSKLYDNESWLNKALEVHQFFVARNLGNQYKTICKTVMAAAVNAKVSGEPDSEEMLENVRVALNVPEISDKVKFFSLQRYWSIFKFNLPKGNGGEELADLGSMALFKRMLTLISDEIARENVISIDEPVAQETGSRWNKLPLNYR